MSVRQPLALAVTMSMNYYLTMRSQRIMPMQISPRSDVALTSSSTTFWGVESCCSSSLWLMLLFVRWCESASPACHPTIILSREMGMGQQTHEKGKGYRLGVLAYP